MASTVPTELSETAPLITWQWRHQWRRSVVN